MALSASQQEIVNLLTAPQQTCTNDVHGLLMGIGNYVFPPQMSITTTAANTPYAYAEYQANLIKSCPQDTPLDWLRRRVNEVCWNPKAGL